MPNHVHILIETGEIPLSTIMQGLQQSYTQYFNTKYNQVGHVFQGRYQAILCNKDSYLLELVRYIHLNPVRAHLVSAPQDYLWTGHIDYLGLRPRSSVDTGFILSLLEPDQRTALESYVRFIIAGIDNDQHEDTLTESANAYMKHGVITPPVRSEKTASTSPQRSRGDEEPAFERIRSVVCESYTISSETLCSNIKIPNAASARRCFCYCARVLTSMSVKTIAGYLHISQSAVSAGIQDVRMRMKKEPRYCAWMQSVLRKIPENL
jgi:hypothetical protein